MVKILAKKFNKNIKFPAYKTSGSSGMDLKAFIKKETTIKFYWRWNCAVKIYN